MSKIIQDKKPRVQPRKDVSWPDIPADVLPHVWQMLGGGGGKNSSSSPSAQGKSKVLPENLRQGAEELRNVVAKAFFSHGDLLNSLKSRVLVLGAPSPRSSRRWNFEISATRAVTRHAVINWEEFGEKFWWVVLHSPRSTKMPRKFRPKFRPILRPEFRPVIKICRRNFALGNVRRNL